MFPLEISPSLPLPPPLLISLLSGLLRSLSTSPPPSLRSPALFPVSFPPCGRFLVILFLEHSYSSFRPQFKLSPLEILTQTLTQTRQRGPEMMRLPLCASPLTLGCLSCQVKSTRRGETLFVKLLYSQHLAVSGTYQCLIIIYYMCSGGKSFLYTSRFKN